MPVLQRREPELGGSRVLKGRQPSRLPVRERRIVELRFKEELTQSEIGARLGVSQMQVSRLLRRALDELQSAAAAETA